jgi:hypothetical protein
MWIFISDKRRLLITQSPEQLPIYNPILRDTNSNPEITHIFVSLLFSNGGSELGGGGVQQIKLRTEVRENRDLGAVAPSQGFSSICKWVKPVFL